MNRLARLVARGIAVATLAALTPAVTAQPAFFQGLGVLPGTQISAPLSISADGTVVVGLSALSSNGPHYPFRWSAATGMTPITGAPDGVAAASGDGSVLAGSAGGQAFRWTEATGMVAQGIPNGWQQSWAGALSSSGQVMVGAIGRTTNTFCPGYFYYLHQYRAYVQIEPQGPMNTLNPLGGDSSSQPSAISSNGAVVAGWSWDAQCDGFVSTEACIWIGGHRHSLHPVLERTVATGVSDGVTVIGYGSIGGWLHAFRWTETEGMVDLGLLLPGAHSVAEAISADGSTIVGVLPGTSSDPHFIWDQAHGMRILEEVLADLGLNLGAWRSLSLCALSADGRTLVGTGTNPAGQQEAWIAFLGDGVCYPDCNADGLLTVADFGCFQTKFVAGEPYADCDGANGLTVQDFGCFQTKFVAGCP